MPDSKPTLASTSERVPANAVVGLAGVGGLIGLMLIAVAGYGQLLPRIAALLVVAGFSIAAVAWVSKARRHDTELTSWDAAALLAFLGFAAGMLA